MTIPARRFFTIIFIVSLINILPMLTRKVGADSWAYQVWMDCFSEQFWRGDIYPRWCFDVRAGLGSPVFFLYPPLFFYVAALFYPLTHFGFTSYDIMVLLYFLYGFFACLTCFHWLRDIVEPRYALLASILFIFMPYHIEMVVFRGVYAEIGAVIWLPLLFKYTRRMARTQQKKYIIPLGIVTGLLMLAYIPTAAIGLLFSGVYMILATGRQLRPKLYYGAGVMLGVILSAFYIVPAYYYQQFLTPAHYSGLDGWSNIYLSPEFLQLPDLLKPLLATLLTSVMLFFTVTCVYINRTVITGVADHFIRKEVWIWLIMAILAWCMIFSFSAPLYMLMGPFSKFLFPWRMQNIVTLGIVYLLAINLQSVFSRRPKQTWKTDYGLLLLCLWASSFMLGASFNSEGDSLTERLHSKRIIFSTAFRPIWVDAAHDEASYLLALSEKNNPESTILSGTAHVRMEAWGWDGIRLQVQAAKAVTIRLNHTYFPAWAARTDGGDPLFLHPEDKTGLMLMDVPAGDHRITLTCGLSNGPFYLSLSQYFSILAWLVVMWRLAMFKTFDNPQPDW